MGNHRGKQYAVPAGAFVSTFSTRRIGLDGSLHNHLAINAAFICETCGDYYLQNNVFGYDTPCVPHCDHCGLKERDHANGHCIFAPTRYKGERYGVIVSKGK